MIGDGSANKIDDGLASLIARAIATRNMLLSGPDDSIEAMASRLGVRRDYLTVLFRLSYVSPEIVHAILMGQPPVELSATRLVHLSKDLPHEWHAQRRVVELPPNPAELTQYAAHLTGRKTGQKDRSRFRR